MPQMGLDWPAWAERTPKEERESGSKFSVGFRRTERDIRKEMDRIGADEWYIEDIKGSGGDPGVVLHWTVDGKEHVLPCDGYDTKAANLRECYIWLEETRKSSERKVSHKRDSFAAAALPGPDEDDDTPNRPPHEILGVQPGAPDELVKQAFRVQAKTDHPDQGGSTSEMSDLKWARDQMMGGDA